MDSVSVPESHMCIVIFLFILDMKLQKHVVILQRTGQRNRKIKMVTELAIMWISRSVKTYSAAIWIV